MTISARVSPACGTKSGELPRTVYMIVLVFSTTPGQELFTVPSIRLHY